MQPIKTFWLEPTGKEEKNGNITQPIYRRLDTGEEMTFAAAPLGAMLDMRGWYPERIKTAADGKLVGVKLPQNADGSGWSYWLIDGPSSTNPTGNPWQRTGTLPDITVSPSIFMNPNGNPPGFHGWLRSGYIISVADPQYTEEECAKMLAAYLAVYRSPGPKA